MGKVKYLQFRLTLEQYYKLKMLMDEFDLNKDEFIALLTNDIEDLRKLFSERKRKVE